MKSNSQSLFFLSVLVPLWFPKKGVIKWEKMVDCLLPISLNLLLISCEKLPQISQQSTIKTEITQGKTIKVERVVNGQTIEIKGFANQTLILEQVQLLGIEAPDLKQEPWGQEAKQKLKQLIEGKKVLLETDPQAEDKLDRKLAYLWQEEILLNEQLVKEGYALVTAPSSNSKYQQRLLKAQEWARIMGLGIWNPDNPLRQSPSEFRNQNRQ